MDADSQWVLTTLLLLGTWFDFSLPKLWKVYFYYVPIAPVGLWYHNFSEIRHLALSLPLQLCIFYVFSASWARSWFDPSSFQIWCTNHISFSLLFPPTLKSPWLLWSFMENANVVVEVPALILLQFPLLWNSVIWSTRRGFSMSFHACPLFHFCLSCLQPSSFHG